MAGGSLLGRIAVVAAVVVGLPATCLLGIALVGRQLSHEQMAEGHVLSPEVLRAQRETRLAAFRALSPAQHLGAARAAMADGFDPRADIGGDFGEATRHLGAIPPGAPEAREAPAILAEIQARGIRAESAAAGVARAVAAAYPDFARSDACGQNHARSDLANRLTRLGIGCVTVHTDRPGVLRIDNPRCSPGFLDRVAGDAAGHDALRRLGLRRVECGGATPGGSPGGSPGGTLAVEL